MINYEMKFGDQNKDDFKCYDIKITIDLLQDQIMFLIMIKDITNDKKVKILQEVDEYKSQLMASVSHELRTPLNGSINLIEHANEEEEIP